jgi:hypothetical protein
MDRRPIAFALLVLVGLMGIAASSQIASGRPPCKRAGQPGCIVNSTATTTTATTTTDPLPPPPAPAPSSTGAPVVSGAAVVGSSLSASAGSWSGSPTGYSYQWSRCDPAGATCAALAGATGNTSTATVGDVGVTLRVRVTASNSGGSAVAASAPTAVVTAPAVPNSTLLPTISGSPVVATTLTASTGTWSGSPTAYAYQWIRCNASGGTCSAISAATASTYTVATADASSTLRLNVMATNSAGTATATSAATSVVQAAPTGSNLYGAWWAFDSPFNSLIPPTVSIDQNSQTWINMLYNSTSVNSIWVNSTAWTTTVYHATSAAPTVTLSVANTGKHIKIPFQAGWLPSPDGDGHIAVIDDTTGCEYEFQAFDAAHLAAHSVAVFHVGTGSGSHVADAGVTGGEMSLLAGLITPRDVASGKINHALRLATPINSPSFRLPATRSDGSLAGGIPEGALIRLDPSLDLTPYNLTPFQLMLARALQTYGAYNDDNAGALAVYAESTTDGSTYSLPITGLPKSFVLKLQVMSSPFTSVKLDSNTNADCSAPY